MVAIITDQLKRQMVQDLFNDIQDSDGAKYYISVGRSQTWNDSDVAPTPINTEREIRNARLNMQAVKRVADFSFVVPRYNWSAGTVYSGYNDNVASHPTTPYYVLTQENAVYICLNQAKNSAGVATASTVEPTGTLSVPFTTADGYTWKFLYTIGTLDAGKYLSANYMPVKLQDSTNEESLAVEIEQEGIQNAAIAGQLANIVVTNSGSGYGPSAPTVSIIGDGVGAAAVATISGGTVTKIEFSESASIPLIGSGYNFAEVKFSGGGSPTSDATARVSIGPQAGFGADPRVDLRAKAIMFNIKPDGEEDGEWLIDNTFRQVCILRNPEIPDSAGLFSAISGNALRRLQTQGTAALNIVIGNTITGQSSDAQAIVDKVDSDEIWYHQTETTGFTQFQEGEVISDGSNTATIQAVGDDADSDAYVEPAVDPFSGTLLYIENRAKIERQSTQTEDIKLIIQL